MMYGVRTDRKSNIRIKGFPRVNIKEIRKLISRT
jgi:hypothetical protein